MIEVALEGSRSVELRIFDVIGLELVVVESRLLSQLGGSCSCCVMCDIELVLEIAECGLVMDKLCWLV